MNYDELIAMLQSTRDNFSYTTHTPFDNRRQAEATLIIDNLIENISNLDISRTRLIPTNLMQFHNQLFLNLWDLSIEILLGRVGTSRESFIESARQLWEIIRLEHNLPQTDEHNLLRPRNTTDGVTDSAYDSDFDTNNTDSTSYSISFLNDIIYENNIADIFLNLKSPQANQLEEQKANNKIEQFSFSNSFEISEVFAIILGCSWFVLTQ